MPLKRVPPIIAGLLLVGCQAAEPLEVEMTTDLPPARAERPSTGTAPTEAAVPAAPTPPPGGLDPATIDPERPIPAGDLMAAYAADPEIWKGKQVSVVGRFLNSAPTRDPSGKLISMGINLALPETWKIAVICNTDSELPKGWRPPQEGRVVKGTVKRAFSSGQVVLEPCECVK